MRLDRVQVRATSMDVVWDYAYPLPIAVISELLGVSRQQADATYLKDLIDAARQQPPRSKRSCWPELAR